MGLLEDLTDKLADDTLNAVEDTGDETLIRKVAAELGSSSPTMEEAFMTSIRFRSAERRARRFLEKTLAGASPPETAGG